MGNVPTSYFPMDLVERVLFAGKVTNMLLSVHEPSATLDGEATAEDDGRPLPPPPDARLIMEAVHVLQLAPEFHPLTVRAVLERIEEVIHTRLWQVLVGPADLLRHLHALREFTLLGHGEFFRVRGPLSAQSLFFVVSIHPFLPPQFLLEFAEEQAHTRDRNLLAVVSQRPADREKRMVADAFRSAAHALPELLEDEAFARCRLELAVRGALDSTFPLPPLPLTPYRDSVLQSSPWSFTGQRRAMT